MIFNFKTFDFMPTKSHRLIQCLKENGIDPPHFAYFISQFIKTRPTRKRAEISLLLTKTMVAQAELIAYHLNR